jgi:hypothetical protein
MTNTLVIARRKRGRVRMFDTRTAKMGPWVDAPTARTVRIAPCRAGKAAVLQAEVRNYWRQTDAALRVDRLTVRELQMNLRTAGITYTSRMRKDQLVGLLLGTEGDS